MNTLKDLQKPHVNGIAPPTRFAALTDAALAFYDTREKKIDQAVDAMKFAMQLCLCIDVPVGPNQFAKIEFRGPDPTKQTYDNLAAILKVMGEQVA